MALNSCLPFQSRCLVRLFKRRIESIYEAAQGNDILPKVIAIIWCLLFVLVLVGFISYIWYALSQTDKNLEEKIRFGNRVESLLALKQHSIESSNTTSNMVLGFAIVAMIMGFGGVLFYIFLSERSRRYEVVSR